MLSPPPEGVPAGIGSDGDCVTRKGLGGYERPTPPVAGGQWLRWECCKLASDN